jgi:DNA-binding NarL/FixJ family response regulator
LDVVVIEDDPSLNDLLRLILNMEDSVSSVRSALTGDEALDMCRSKLPDLVIADSVVQGSGDVQPGRQIRDLYPRVRIISFSGKDGDRPWADLQVTKTGKGLDDVIEAVRAVASRVGMK